MSSMLQTTALPTHHADLVTDIAYDYYGLRLATASADQRIKIWRKRQNGIVGGGGSRNADGGNDGDDNGAGGGAGEGNVVGGWELEDEWKAHEAPILSLSWSHPSSGSLLASSSYDRSLRIWEETDVPSNLNLSSTGLAAASGGNVNGGGGGMNGGSGGAAGMGTGTGTGQNKMRWLERAYLADAKGSVRKVEWVPGGGAFGLKVASLSTDSYLRIYTSLSPTLSDWQLTQSIYIPSLSLSQSLSSPYNQNPQFSSHDSVTAQPGSSLGSNQSASSFALGGGQGSSSGGSGGGGLMRGGGNNGLSGANGNVNEALSGWGMSWIKEKWWGMVVAVTAGAAGTVKIVNLSSPIPTALLLLEPTSSGASTSTTSTPHGSQAITSLSWAPNCGRSYHSIATGSRDGSVRVWKVVAPEPGEVGEWTGEVVGEWGKGEATVGKVEWNVTGSILSVSSEDGQVRLYKATFAGKWACMGSFSAEAPNMTEENDLSGRMQE